MTQSPSRPRDHQQHLLAAYPRSLHADADYFGVCVSVCACVCLDHIWTERERERERHTERERERKRFVRYETMRYDTQGLPLLRTHRPRWGLYREREREKEFPSVWSICVFPSLWSWLAPAYHSAGTVGEEERMRVQPGTSVLFCACVCWYEYSCACVCMCMRTCMLVRLLVRCLSVFTLAWPRAPYACLSRALARAPSLSHTTRHRAAMTLPKP